MTMEALEQMMAEETSKSQEELEQLEGVGQELTLEPTGVQTDAGSKLVTIYHRLTGAPRTIPKVYAEQALLKRFRAKDGAGLDGTFVFSTKPTVPYVLGTVRCLLHPSQPERPQYDAWGIPTCHSEHFPSEYEARRHVENDHPSAWTRLQQIKTEAQAEEDRMLQRESIRIQNELLLSTLGGKQAPSDALGVMRAIATDMNAVVEKETFSDKPKGGRPKGSKNKKNKK